MNIKEERLKKRNWLINNFEYLFKEALYYRAHKFSFTSIKQKLWHVEDAGEGRVHVDS